MTNSNLTPEKVIGIRKLLSDYTILNNERLKQIIQNQYKVKQAIAEAYVRNRIYYLSRPEMMNAPVVLGNYKYST